MSTVVTLVIIAVVVIAIALIIGFSLRARRRRQSTVRMRLPALGALSGEGLDKQHAAAGRAERHQTADQPRPHPES